MNIRISPINRQGQSIIPQALSSVSVKQNGRPVRHIQILRQSRAAMTAVLVVPNSSSD